MMMVMILSTRSTRAYDPPHFWPANIFGGGTAEAGEEVLLKCRIFDRDVSNSELHMYLCKDGGGVMMEPLVNKDEYTFTLTKVTVQDSGSYSCVYSINKFPTRNVTSGQNSAYIHVTGIAKTAEQNSDLVQLSDALPDFRPAKIFGNPLVKVGENIELKCIIFDKSKPSDRLHMYLCKNGVGVRMGPLEQSDEHTFILRNISEQDSGNYSCVYSPKKYTSNDVRASGQKTIQVQVTDASENPQKNLSTNEQNSDPVQLSGISKTNEQGSDLAQLSDRQWLINFMRLLGSFGVVIFACLILVFDVYSTKRRNSAALNSKFVTSLDLNDQ
ncbi:hypothetical protein NFI96_025440 [Prochilodus magdalenae]|nr:hypothetical protein NFI96_025440 [Prochilodus magdalenae]